MPASPYTLNTDQLEMYLQRIHYADHATPMAAGHPRLEQLHKAMEHCPLTALAELQRRHLGAITWGNTALHYSTHHSISIYPACVFEKLVVRCLDGYCMENTNLLYMVLCSLGYQVYATGGRVSRTAVTGDPTEEGYISLLVAPCESGVKADRWLMNICRSHMILIVTIDGQKYMVDVGFGRNTPTSPFLLKENTTVPLIAPSEMSLIRAPLAEFMDQTQKVWIYQVRADPQSPWVTQYSFSEIEFLFEDFRMINFFTSKSRTLMFTHKLACTRLILDDHDSQPIGIYILAGREVKRVLRGKTETLQVLNTEEDRVGALAECFNMNFHANELEGIRGLPSQIKPR
ncbi:cysteine proteinase [Aspergillus granulosus]|uniref:Cysteine proteinase n=1 Tax=Aspergillus granulosus TaxID=176169 RepID=A0ABR4HND2_9EURO